MQKECQEDIVDIKIVEEVREEEKKEERSGT